MVQILGHVQEIQPQSKPGAKLAISGPVCLYKPELGSYKTMNFFTVYTSAHNYPYDILQNIPYHRNIFKNLY